MQFRGHSTACSNRQRCEEPPSQLFFFRLLCLLSRQTSSCSKHVTCLFADHDYKMPRLTPTADMKGGNMSTNHTSIRSYTLSKVFIPGGRFISPVKCLRYYLFVSFVPYTYYTMFIIIVIVIFYYCQMRVNKNSRVNVLFSLWRFRLVLSAGSLPLHHLIACMVAAQQSNTLNSNHLH